MLTLFICSVLAVLSFSHAQDANCNFVLNVSAGGTAYVYSPGYPASYRGQMTCRWIGICPQGYVCRLDCPEINLPQSPSCQMDRLLISRTGDPLLASPETYCGRGTLSISSKEERISVGLITVPKTPGGRFFCTLKAQPVAVTPPPCRCGYKKSNRIVGGVETGMNEFPMMAGIVDVSIRRIKCGGVIISKSHVMSAAHCVINMRIDNIAVVVGEHDVNTGDSPVTQGFRVIEVTTHPLYRPTNYDYDVSILKLYKDIVFSELVGPVCLPFKFIYDDFAGAKVTILGWGTIFPGGPTSPVLQKVDVDVISQPACQRAVSTLTPRQLCTFTQGKDACQYDSGGPLLYTDQSNGLLYSVGIVSYGSFCASGSPGVNTRVTTILDWIVAVTQTEFCDI
ncbi:venom serine protease-like [Battus philenor]|uniref:venom serine protease-like n=1 Tax=Battus philenor TaxID=42288 RepID=UPI0035CF290B